MCKRLMRMGLVLLAVASGAGAFQVLDPAYQAEVYAEFFTGWGGGPSGMAFGADGRLYTTNYYGGYCYEIETDGQVTLLHDDMATCERIEWTGGTTFGESFLITERGIDGLTRMNPDGTLQHFAAVGDEPLALALDRNGTYGGDLFVGTNVADKVYRVKPDGTATVFSYFPHDMGGGGPRDMCFDPGQRFGGQLYLANWSSYPDYSGLFGLDAVGIETQFAPDVARALQIEIDAVGLFGSDMYVVGRRATSDVDNTVFRIDPSGQVTDFIIGEPRCFAMEFGPDGALYVCEIDSATTRSTVYRVTPIPEPTGVLLLGLGAGVLRRRRHG